MLTYSKKDSYIIPVTASFIGLSVKLRLPHTSHLTPHTSHLTTAGLDEAEPPGFHGECFICELRLPDHRFRWKHNKLFCFCRRYGPAFPAIVDCYTSPPTLVWPVPLLHGFPALTVYYLRFVKTIDALSHRVVIRVACTPC